MGDTKEDEYEAVFNAEDRTLGLVISDEGTGGNSAPTTMQSMRVLNGEAAAASMSRRCRVYVKMVVAGESAQRQGVTEGSTLVAVNVANIEGRTYKECSGMIRQAG